VPRILVADDNSNIQKMVGLALKDQGIDVVAVGNGEAAVRKISDIKPDLVLADVFMPVRNGYEVCKYVKDDPSLAHIPVILLVGAFDPLDEQEAQRVGADGVLKKPFVPPDPLISMVKSALARAGVSYSKENPADKTPEPGTLKTTDLLPKPAAPTAPVLPTIPVFEPAKEFVPVLENENFVDEAPAGPVPVKIDSGSQPLAFGSMLEAAPSKEEDDAAFLQTQTTAPAMERDWGTGKEEAEDPEETIDEPKQTWRRDGADEAFESSTPSRAVQDWRDTSIASTPSQQRSHDGWQPSKEKSTLTEAAAALDNLGGVATKISTNGDSHVSPAETAPASFAGDAWAKAIGIASEEKAPEPVAQVAAPAAEETPAVAPEPAKSSWFSTPSSPWDNVAQKANRLASTWDAPVTAPVVEEKAAEAEPVPESVSNGYSAESLVAEETNEPVPHPKDLPEVADDLPAPAAIPETTSVKEELSEAVSAEVKDAAAKAESQDELVAKVLAKMSPEMLQAITREILKPVVEAMVKEQLDSKK
jgi:CheY-like chemotaxis protein